MNPDLLVSIGQFVGALALLILLHELGHFFAARLLGIEIEELGIGYPPRLVKLFEAGGTIYSLNWIPLGGFVRPKGENNPEVEGGLAAASPWTRIAVLAAGPGANFLAGLLLYAFLFTQVGLPGLGPVQILEVSPNSPAERAGLQSGDLILEAEGTEIESFTTLQNVILSNLGEEIELRLERDGQEQRVELVPRTEWPENDGAIGIVMSNPNPPRNLSLPAALMLGGGAVVEQSRLILTLPFQLIEGRVEPEEARLVGYKGMFDIYQDFRESETDVGTPAGAGALFFFASISVSLGLLNLLPIPALDGGRILFALPEIVLRRRIPPAYQNLINIVGLAMLILLAIYINLNDFINPAQLR